MKARRLIKKHIRSLVVAVAGVVVAGVLLVGGSAETVVMAGAGSGDGVANGTDEAQHDESVPFVDPDVPASNATVAMERAVFQASLGRQAVEPAEECKKVSVGEIYDALANYPEEPMIDWMVNAPRGLPVWACPLFSYKGGRGMGFVAAQSSPFSVGGTILMGGPVTKCPVDGEPDPGGSASLAECDVPLLPSG